MVNQVETTEFTEDMNLGAEEVGGIRSTFPGIPIEVITGATANGGTVWNRAASTAVTAANMRNFNLIHAALDMQIFRSGELNTHMATWSNRPDAVVAKGRLELLRKDYDALAVQVLNSADDPDVQEPLARRLLEVAKQQDDQLHIIENRQDLRIWCNKVTMGIIKGGLQTRGMTFWDRKWQLVDWPASVSLQIRNSVPGWGELQENDVYFVATTETLEGVNRRIRVERVIWKEDLSLWLGGRNPHGIVNPTPAPAPEQIKEVVLESTPDVAGFEEPTAAIPPYQSENIQSETHHPPSQTLNVTDPGETIDRAIPDDDPSAPSTEPIVSRSTTIPETPAVKFPKVTTKGTCPICGKDGLTREKSHMTAAHPQGV